VVLAALVSSSALGVYSLSYQICAVLGTVLTEFNRAALPAYGHEHAATTVARVATSQSWLVVTLGCAALLAAPQVLPVVLPEAFDRGADLAYPLILAMVLFGLYYPCANVVTMRQNRAFRIGYATSAALATNVAMDLALVPVWGIRAAAWATTCGYGVLLAGALWLIPSPIRRMLLPAALSSASVLTFGFVMSNYYSVPQWLAPCGLLAFAATRLELRPRLSTLADVIRRRG
jgi:O-antigen/teichoic acid export membrane protein